MAEEPNVLDSLSYGLVEYRKRRSDCANQGETASKYMKKDVEEVQHTFEYFLLKPELHRAIVDGGFQHPSRVQLDCIPQAILGRDMICQAKSGMGKTTLFIVATLQQIKPVDGQISVIVLCHTKELALRICKEYQKFSKYMSNIKAAYFFRGIKMRRARETLEENCPHIVVGTPRRILTLAQEKSLNMDHIKHLILDECDKLLKLPDMRGDTQEIIKSIPHKKQVMAFSIVYPKDIRQVCNQFTRDPLEICVDNESKLTLYGLQQYYVKLQEKEKKNKLVDLLNVLEFDQVIVFVKTVKGCVDVVQLLEENKYPVVTIHRNLSQDERSSLFRKLTGLPKHILVTTNLYGTGMDIEKANIVFNYDMPNQPDTYLHRVACAGRFGSKGLSISFLSGDLDAKVIDNFKTKFQVEIGKLPDKIDVSTYYEKVQSTPVDMNPVEETSLQKSPVSTTE